MKTIPTTLAAKAKTYDFKFGDNVRFWDWFRDALRDLLPNYLIVDEQTFEDSSDATIGVLPKSAKPKYDLLLKKQQKATEEEFEELEEQIDQLFTAGFSMHGRRWELNGEDDKRMAKIGLRSNFAQVAEAFDVRKPSLVSAVRVTITKA